VFRGSLDSNILALFQQLTLVAKWEVRLDGAD
jgi:hypothetical protein